MLKQSEVTDKRVLEVGSMDVNGSLRPIVEALSPAEYVGVDIRDGHGVDKICGVERLVEVFGEDAFDLVISTEMLEHVREWRGAISNMKRVCRRNGIILATTRSIGFHYHAYPSDFWRFEPEDIQQIFSDMELEALERDVPGSPGVMAKVKKPTHFEERDLSGLSLYSVIEAKRINSLSDQSLSRFLAQMQLRGQLSLLLTKVTKNLFRPT